MGKEGTQDVGDEHKAHGEKNLFEELEAAKHCQVPQHQRDRHHKPHPRDTRYQFETTTNSSQIGCNQRDIADDQQERGCKRHRSPIMFAQELRQPLLTDASNFCAGKLYRVIERSRQQHQP